MKMKEHSRAYKKEAINIALSLVVILQCQNCGHPVVKGYCCGHCGSDQPTFPHQEPSELEV